MKRVAIIGSKGYIGKHIELFLKNEGHCVECYDIVSDEKSGCHKCDLTNVDSVKSIDTNVDYIFVLAGLTGTYVGFDKAEMYININEIGLINLLNHVRQSAYRPHIIFPSTRLIYRGAEKALKEEDIQEAKTIYAVNKIACEHILYAYRNSFGIPYTIFRICVPFGNMLNNDYSFGTIGFFIRQSRDNGEITLYGDGSAKRTFTSMHDLCRQMVNVGMKDCSDGEIYNIGGRTYSLREAAEYVAAHYNAKVIFTPWPEQDIKIESGSTYFDSSKIEEVVGEKKYDGLETLNLS